MEQRQPKTLDELNLLDNFLFQEMVSRGKDGERFCQILLSTILGKKVKNVHIIGQRHLQGQSTSAHGICMDAYIEASELDADSDVIENIDIKTNIYDIEPNTYQTKNEAKRSRYYHSLIDTKILKSGLDYHKLKDVMLIMIMPYDPFGKKRMVYTIQSHCVEEPSMPYDDGRKTVFLYTKGNLENGSKDLQNMLHYLQETKSTNVCNSDLQEIHDMVTAIRKDEEVGVNYMQSWEKEMILKEEGIMEGIRIGEERGIQIGEERGIQIGEQQLLTQLIQKKISKNIPLEQIAAELEEDIDVIRPIYEGIIKS